MVKTRSQSTDDVRESDGSDGNVLRGGSGQHPRLIAKAIVDHEATNFVELSFKTGDEMTNVKEISPNLYEGIHKATQKKGVFRKDHVLPYLETKEEQQPVRESPVRAQPVFHYAAFAGKPESESIVSNKNDSLHTLPKNFLLPLLVVVIAVAVVLWMSSWPLFFGNYRKMRVNITELKIQFSSQEPGMWDTLRAGLMSSKTEGVQTFLFLHNSPRTAVCFIKKLSDNRCVTYRANGIINSESFVSELKEKLLVHKCLIMYDLEDLSLDGVAVLKGFCDAYTAIVPDTQFFFALNAGPHIDAEAKFLARNLLEAKWLKDFTHDDFGGTLTRLTQNVLKIRNEPNVPC